MLAVVLVEDCSGKQLSGKKMRFTREPIAFNDNDLEGTIQPHDDALVVTTIINGFIVKRVMVDQGSRVDAMYLDLFKGLGLKDEDLLKYDTPLFGFNGQVVIPEGANFPSREYGRKESSSNIYSGRLVFSLYGNPGKAMDLCHGGSLIHSARESYVPY